MKLYRTAVPIDNDAVLMCIAAKLMIMLQPWLSIRPVLQLLIQTRPDEVAGFGESVRMSDSTGVEHRVLCSRAVFFKADHDGF